MENVILVVHLILVACLIGIVLLQRSEGGGLGMGGGGGTSSRAAATALGKLTWVFGVGFLVTSIALTVISAQNAGGNSLVERFSDGSSVPAPIEAELPDLGDGAPLLPPSTSDAPLLPPRAE